MARPAIPDEKYFEELTSLCTNGEKPKKITATELQIGFYDSHQI